MAYTNPSIPDFKAYFNRDFPYSEDVNVGVTNWDLEKAFVQATMNINPSLFESQITYNVGFLLLWAHYLVVDLRMSSQGVNGQYSWIESSKSVGSVSQSFTVPQQILNNPYFAMLTKTNYGAKYVEVLLPLLVGQVFVVPGRTLP